MADKLRDGINAMLNKESNKKAVFGVPLAKDFEGHDDRFRYQMLDRLRSDLDYYLGHGLYSENQLWNSDKKPETTVELMKGLYDSFDEKPQWLGADKIRDYEKRLAEPVKYNPEYHDYFRDRIKENPYAMSYYRETYPDNKRLNQLLDLIEKM